MASRRAHFVDNTIRVNLAKPDEAPGDLAIPAIIRHDARLPVENWRVFVTRALPSERVARRSPGVKNADISLTQKETDALDLTDTSIIMQHGRRLGKNEPNVEIGRVLSSHTGKDGHVYTVNAINTDNSAYGKGRINEYYGDLVKSGAINSVSLRIDAYVDDKGRIAKRAFPELSLVMPGYEPVHKDCGVLDWKTLPEDVRSGLYSKMYSKFTPDQLGKWSICPNEPLLENKYPVELSMERAETQQPMVQANALGADPARDSRRVASFAHLVACYANDVVEENRMTAPFVEIVVEKESPEYLELLQIVSANASSAQAQEPAPAEAGAAIPQPAGAAPAAEALQSAPASSNAAPSETGQAASTADAAGAAAPVVPGTDSTAIYSMLLEILKRIPPSLVPNQQGESRDSAVQKQEAAPETVSAESTQAAAPDSTEGRRQESAEKVDAAPGVPAPAPAQTADLLAGAVGKTCAKSSKPGLHVSACLHALIVFAYYTKTLARRASSIKS